MEFGVLRLAPTWAQAKVKEPRPGCYPAKIISETVQVLKLGCR